MDRVITAQRAHIHHQNKTRAVRPDIPGKKIEAIDSKEIISESQSGLDHFQKQAPCQVGTFLASRNARSVKQGEEPFANSSGIRELLKMGQKKRNAPRLNAGKS
ncbi:uncharacterized protein N7487_006282 [Penicillium crustosum]|uniref:uncharacterized protein n=1 Tax=Penicillium crustosum TaxID=36656 RepID=UPI00238B2AAF|nr:uncharacterized protein N7487_006282 [Penicillium crustosum]KAJ5411923.1 hypothetical protein N7487_006282 [Penicillium crustosum]